MAKSLHYPQAPITEAIIDLRVQPAGGVDRALLKQLGRGEEAAYPKQEEVVEAVGKMAVGPSGGSASVQQSPVGWKFTSQDGKQIAQCRVNGFTFSRLAPYESWKPFRDEAKRLWDVYRTTLSPESVTRLAVRYINRIDIPGDTVDLKHYFRTSPEIAPELPQQLHGYFMHLEFPVLEISGLCLINQTIVPPARVNAVSVVLDIDLFRAQDLPQDQPGIWSLFEQLHDQKNRIFESCITDATRSLFSPCQS